MSKYDALWAYIQGRNEETLVLSFADIAQIAGTPLEQRSYFIYDTIVDRLLLDCNETEQEIIIRTARELKATLVSLGI